MYSYCARRAFGSYDAWTTCLTTVLAPQYLLHGAPNAATAAWSFAYERLNQVFLAVDPRCALSFVLDARTYDARVRTVLYQYLGLAIRMSLQQATHCAFILYEYL